MSKTRIFRGVKTSLRNENGTLIGNYRGTDVCRKSGNVITLNSNGWQTVTTKVRFNQFSHQFCGSKFYVQQEKGNWFIRFRDGSEQLTYSDGVTFSV